MPRRYLCRILALAALAAFLSPVRASVWYVDEDASGSVPDGASWATAYTMPEHAGAVAKPGDEIWVACRTYSNPFTLPAGVSLYGGFKGTETRREERDPVGYPTTFQRAVTVAEGSVTETNIDGFVFWNAGAAVLSQKASLVLTNNVFVSSVIDCRGGSLVFRNNVVTSNSDPRFAPFIQCTNATVEIIGNRFTECVHAPPNWGQPRYVLAHGGALYLENVSGTVSNNVISNNKIIAGGAMVYGYGAGIYASDSHLFLSDNVITGNRIEVGGGDDAAAAGAGLQISGGVLVLANNLIARNSIRVRSSHAGEAHGAGVSLGGAAAVVANNTIAFNTITNEAWAPEEERGGGISFYKAEGDLGSVEAVNNVVAFNSSGVDWEGVAPIWRHNDVHGNGLRDYPSGTDPTGTAGNISKAPLFIDPEGSDFRMLPLSPAIDTGDDLAVRTPFDLDGRPRLQGAHVDMGAYEAAVNPTLTIADVRRALAIAAGMEAATSLDRFRLNLHVEGSNAIDIRDALRVARRVFGRDTNP